MTGIFEQPLGGKGGPVDREIGEILAEDDLRFGLEHIRHLPKTKDSEGGQGEREKKLPPHETR